MKQSEHIPLERFSMPTRKVRGTIEDAPEICSFTLEPCLLGGGAPHEDDVCPFTLEPVCICNRAVFAGWN